MANDSTDTDEFSYLRPFPWLRLFRAAGVASDAKKLILAALGLMLYWAGTAALDRLVPGTAAAEARGWGALPPSPLGGREAIGRAASMVADPARVVVGPYLRLFESGAGWAALGRAAPGALWATAVWGIVGGAIARIATVQLATGERVGMVAALRFALGKWVPLVGAPLSPWLGVACFAAPCALMGLLYQTRSPAVLTAMGALAFLPLIAGLVMAIIVVGLAAGWPLMHATVAAEGEDGFDALSRSYAYAYQRPWRYAAYAALAWAIGTVGLLLAGLFARAVIALALWALALGAPDDLLRDLFAGMPTAAPALPTRLHSAWLQLAALLAYGWAFSYFWSAASAVYLLLRRDVDGTAWDDIAMPGHESDPFAPEPEPTPADQPSEAAEPTAAAPPGPSSPRLPNSPGE